LKRIIAFDFRKRIMGVGSMFSFPILFISKFWWNLTKLISKISRMYTRGKKIPKFSQFLCQKITKFHHEKKNTMWANNMLFFLKVGFIGVAWSLRSSALLIVKTSKALGPPKLYQNKGLHEVKLSMSLVLVKPH
jgi:hypothetical protein